MKKSIVVIVVSLVATVLMLSLLGSIWGNKADQAMINTVPEIKELDPRSSEWGKYFPRQYDSYMATQKSDDIKDILKKDPNLVVLWAGYGFSKDYNEPRGHFYMLEDNINTLRTGAPVDENTGPMPTACWTCKSPDVPRLMKEKGDLDFFTGKWARWGDEIVNPVGCADCHDNKTMQLSVKRDFLARALNAEGSEPFDQATHQDMRTLVCVQCHAEYYFKKTEWEDPDGTQQTAAVVTFPWDNGLSVEDIEQYYDERKFSDWTHKLSKAPMLKAQHPGYETFKTGIHGQNNLACADCHMPYVREGSVKYSNHKIGSPLANISNTCLICHGESEEQFKQIVARKLERKEGLAASATDILAKAHFEAAKAWELGANEAEMEPALMDIRHGQWRWDFAVAAHGGFFHAPEETLRILGTAIDKGHDARLKLRIILAKYGAAEYEGPVFSSKEEAQELVGLQMEKLVDEKITFLNTLREKWIQNAATSGKNIYDPKAEVKEFKVSYRDEN